MALICTVAQLKPGVFEHTTSPSKRWAIGYAHDPHQKDDEYAAINTLVDLKTHKPVLTLNSFNGFPGQNHGGIFVAYSQKESMGVAMQAGKWEPRALAIFSPSKRLQFNLLPTINKDMAAYAKKHVKNADKFAFDVLGAKFSGGKLLVSAIGQIPKDEDAPVIYAELKYPTHLSGGKIRLKNPTMKPLSESTAWSWPEIK